MSTRAISKEIEQNVSVKESDVYGVLIELVNVIKRELQSGHIVRIDRLGSFRLGIKTKPANSAKEFTALKNVVGYRVNFMPEYTVTRNESGKAFHVVTLVEGASSREAAEYEVNKEADDTTEGEQTA